KRGKIMDENLEILNRLFTEEKVDGEYMFHKISAAVMYPKPYQKPRMPILIGGYVDKVLQRAATVGDGWLTYFYRPEDFKKSWAKMRNFAEEGGKDPDTLLNASQLPIMVGDSKAAVQDEMMDWLNKEWDFPAYSDCTRESAIMGNVDECVAQLQEQIDAGVQKIIFVPYKYRPDQVEVIAKEIIPRLKAL
ncbi:MAG: LLM class F420-dependent oxidoreductase, partial [Rhizobiales bacterium 35-66-30]